MSRGAPDWGDMGRTALAAAAVAVLLALAKYFKAQGDPQLGATLAALGTEVSARTGASDAAE